MIIGVEIVSLAIISIISIIAAIILFSLFVHALKISYKVGKVALMIGGVMYILTEFQIF